MAYVDRGVHVFGCIRGSSFASPTWLTCIAVNKPLVANGVFYKPLVACVDRRSQAFGCRWCHLQAFGGVHGSSSTSLWWLLLGFKSLWWQMESFTGSWWLTWIAVHKLLVAGAVFYKAFVACVRRRSQVFGGIWSHLQAFGGIRGSSCTRFFLAYVDRRAEACGGKRGLSIASLWLFTLIAVYKPLLADGVVDKPLVAYVDYRV